MKGKYIFLLFTLFIGVSVTAQKKSVVTDFEFTVDTSVSIYTRNHIQAGIVAKTVRGKTKITRGLLRGRYPWKRFVVIPENCSFTNGVIHYSISDLIENKDSIKLTVSPKNNRHLVKTIVIPIVPIRRFKINLYGNSIRQNEQIEFSIWAELENGAVLKSDAQERINKLGLNDFSYTIGNSPVDRHQLWIPSFFETIPRRVPFIASFGQNNILSDTVFVEVNYSYNNRFVYDHKSGRPGKDGRGVDIFQNGVSGADGENGHNAMDCHLYIDGEIVGSDTLIRCMLQHNGKLEKFVCDPFSSSIAISANGANGGDGGDGANGLDGVDATDSTAATVGTNGGWGGNGGNGGRGADIYIFADELGSLFLDLFRVENKGGKGGLGGIGGKGGRDGKTNKERTVAGKLFNALLPGRGQGGDDGRNGADGADGLILFDGAVPDNTIKRMMNNARF